MPCNRGSPGSIHMVNKRHKMDELLTGMIIPAMDSRSNHVMRWASKPGAENNTEEPVVSGSSVFYPSKNIDLM